MGDYRIHEARELLHTASIREAEGTAVLELEEYLAIDALLEELFTKEEL